MEIQKPDILFSRDNVDFGKGFYTAPLREQAVRWAARFKQKQGRSVISLYELDDVIIRENTSVLEFELYSDDWHDFILACRSGKKPNDRYDVVIGGVANDKVFDTIELFFDGLIDKAEAIKRLRYEQPNLQICFCKQFVMDEYLKFVSSEEV
jgi:hypothetical protein